MSKKELAKRYVVFIISLFFSGLGVAVTKHGELGVSPISSVANVMSIRFSFCSMGLWLFIWNCVLLLGQILLLRREFPLISLLQIPLSVLFGWFTDIGLWIAGFLPVGSYGLRVLYVVAGVVILAFGIALAVIANVIMNSGEAFVKALALKLGREFAYVKIGFDIGCVMLSVLLSLLFFEGHVIGTREGTLFAAVFTGMGVRFFQKKLQTPIEAILVRREVVETQMPQQEQE